MISKIKSLSNYVAELLFIVLIAMTISFLTGCATAGRVPSAQAKEAYIAQWRLTGVEADNIRRGKVWVGASWRDVHAAIGKPTSVSVSRGRNHHLTMRYPCHNLYFVDGELRLIQDAYRCSGRAAYPPPALPYPNFGVRRF